MPTSEQTKGQAPISGQAMERTSSSESSESTKEQSPVSGQARRQKKPHAWFACVIFLVILLATNGVLCFVLEPYRSSSQEMWENYSQLAASGVPQPDTIIVGTSEGLSGINPAYLDLAGVTTSYNMSTNMQSLPSSLKIIQIAAEDHPIRKVILVIDHEILHIDRSEDKRAEQALWYARMITCRFPENIRTACYFLTDPDMITTSASLTFLTPWVYNRSSNIRLNVREKLAGQVLEEAGHRLPNGYEPDESVVDQSIHFVTLEEAAQWDEDHKDTVNFQELSISQKNLQALEQIAVFCQQNGIELHPVVAPYPNYLNIYRLQDYRNMYDELSTLFASYGFTYYDFNLIRPEYLAMETTDFKDVGHLNSQGAEKFSIFLGEFLKNIRTAQGKEEAELMFAAAR